MMISMDDEIETRTTLGDTLGAICIWIQDASIQIAAQRNLLRQHCRVTDDEWRRAVADAKASFPPEAPLNTLSPGLIRLIF